MLSLIESTFASLAVPIVGMVIPSYLSFKALNGKGEPKALLAYWVCFAIYMQVTFLFETLCLHVWVPLYYMFKVGGLCYLVASQVRLAHDYSSAHQQELTRRVMMRRPFARRPTRLPSCSTSTSTHS